MASKKYRKGSIREAKKAFKKSIKPKYWQIDTVVVFKSRFVFRRANKSLGIKKSKEKIDYICFSYQYYQYK